MRVLVVARAHDENDGEGWIDTEGELAVLPPPAAPHDELRSTVPGGFVGLDSMDAASIVAVADMDVSPHVLMDYVRESLLHHHACDTRGLRDVAAQLTAEMLDIARRFPAGTVLTVDGATLTAHIPVRHAGRSPACDPRRRDRRGR